MSALRNVNLEIAAAAVGGQRVEAKVGFQFRSMNSSFPTVTVVELIAEDDSDSVVFASTLTGMTSRAELHPIQQFKPISVETSSGLLVGRWPDKPGKVLHVRARVTIVQCEDGDPAEVPTVRVASLRPGQRAEYSARI